MQRFSRFRYHIELVRLLACCTMGKNAYTEIKCHSLLPLDDIVNMVCHRDTIPEVKEAYVNFLTHCYIDTEVEMKEIYTSSHMWQLFERSFLLDMGVVSNATHDRRHADLALEHYVTETLMDIITTFFKSPFLDQSITVQVRTGEGGETTFGLTPDTEFRERGASHAYSRHRHTTPLSLAVLAVSCGPNLCRRVLLPPQPSMGFSGAWMGRRRSVRCNTSLGAFETKVP